MAGAAVPAFSAMDVKSGPYGLPVQLGSVPIAELRIILRMMANAVTNAAFRNPPLFAVEAWAM